MDIKFNTLTPNLWTLELDKTIAFYTTHLGFQCLEKNEEWQWALVKKDNLEIMFSKPNEHIPFQQSMFSGSFYFNIQNVDVFWEVLKDKAEVCYAIEDFPWQMREFAIYDNNGYILQFGQDMEGLK
ncbi:TPA: bleomycin resistance family protein [Elizabethkingia meningoseptica]|uniref:VOC family protein n=1 Tax=Elizabethkingia meningoseptica TaxID=238 RepID=UPI0022F18BFB|nr:VOC family protein [Elizabethkingia meningoseptica]EJK5328736.1 VOC family protein [Elizabethkingia meningoseptica]MDE5526229.1 VOC family protein [Elizabethkingia meningoseptica]WBS75333.1 VOC family protein [Elizabethkingia meningoseptica]HAY3564378.1 bleomycin resistance family protein [Elizabethkingia meningoseptica]